ncbi:hypothetical protein HXA32_06310 [Salipaludibacillus agaradhaerens]|uniref:hypothetical protein n=1 Tax=Salipaludibacillus agaradhaerens TaxID=76935 RepID=UPI002150BA41|nr:hypothetical protein [Salipaludibacillus agaradhaerens]MCR6105891.1 hypothetical protein [Salipaludibacillus agaradhaerens]
MKEVWEATATRHVTSSWECLLCKEKCPSKYPTFGIRIFLHIYVVVSEVKSWFEVRYALIKKQVAKGSSQSYG